MLQHRPAYGGNGGGYDEDQASRLLEQDNDAEIARLHAKVARIKQVTLDIRDEVGRQNDFLGEAVRCCCDAAAAAAVCVCVCVCHQFAVLFE